MYELNPYATYQKNTPQDTPKRWLTKEIATAESTSFLQWGFPNYNPDELVQKKGILTYNDMRKDDQIKACQQTKISARLSTGYEIKAGDEKNVQSREYAEFITDQLHDIKGTFKVKLRDILTARDFGYSITEKVLGIIQEGRWAGKIGLMDLKTKEPYDFTFKMDEFRNLQGIIRENVINPRGDDFGSVKNPYPIHKFVVYSANKEFVNPYGRSDLREVYMPWFSKNIIMKFFNIYLERFGQPTIMASYPDKVSEDKDFMDLVDDLLSSYQTMTGFRIPEGVKIELLEAKRRGDAGYKDAIEMYDKRIARGLLWPDLALQAGEKGGSHALAKDRFSLFVLILDEMGYEIEDPIMQDQIIDPLILLNWGIVDKRLRPTFKFEPIHEANTELRAKIVDIMVKAGVVKPDEEWVREWVNIPAKSKALIKEEKEAKEKAEDAEDSKVPDEDGDGDEEGNDKVVPFSEAEYIIANRAKIRNDIRNLVKLGKIKKPEFCARCKQKFNPCELQHHHADYRKPLEIQWFCQKCHAIVDGRKEGLIKKKFEASELRRQPTEFESKVDFVQLNAEMDSYEEFMQAELEEVTKKWKRQVMFQADKIFKTQDNKAINKMNLKNTGEFKNILRDWLIKIHLDSKFRDTNVLRESGMDVRTEKRPIPKSVGIKLFSHEYSTFPEFDAWSPMPLKQSVEFFNSKRLAFIKKDGKEKRLFLANGKELRFYDDSAFAITGIEQQHILNQSKMIMFDAVKSGDTGTAFKNLDALFAKYIDEGAISENLRNPNRLDTIIRTNTNDALNRGREALFNDPDVDEFVPFVEVSAVRDDRTTAYCEGLDTNVYRKADAPSFPAHFSCRTDLIPFTRIEAEEKPPTVHSLADDEAKLRATGKAGAVRGVGFGGTPIIKEKKREFEIIKSTKCYDHSNRADVYIASTGSVIDSYNIVSIKDASILYLINLDERNIEIEKVTASNDFKHGTIKLIKNMRIDGDGEIKGSERITPVAVGRGQVKANVRCMIWDGSGNGMEGLVGGEVIKTTILKEGDNKASLGTIVLKTGESLAVKYDYDMNLRGQLVGGGDFECSIRFSYEG